MSLVEWINQGIFCLHEFKEVERKKIKYDREIIRSKCQKCGRYENEIY